MSCMENTDVWDGGVPFIIGSPMSLPNVFSVQAHAMRILWEKFPQIVDAVDPGGSGDMYAGLSAEEREALEEVTRMGFPPRAWFDVKRIAQGYTGVWSMLGNNMIKYDPDYFEDFWNVPGYLGANPTESLLQARIQHKATVVKPIMADEARGVRARHGRRDLPERGDGRHPDRPAARRASRRQPHGRHAVDDERQGAPATTSGSSARRATSS